MLFQTLSELLQNHSYPILLLFIALLGFSAGLYQAPPLISRCEQEKPPIAKLTDREADYRLCKHLGTGRPARMQRDKEEELQQMSTLSIVDGGNGLDAMQQREKTQAREGKAERIKAEAGWRQRFPQESSARPAWLRSLSLESRRHTANATAQDSNPRRAPEKRERVMQRKVSLTGEEVKEMADAFIARMHKRMWVQRQESLKHHSQPPGL